MLYEAAKTIPKVCIKINSKWIKDLNTGAKIVEKEPLLEENTEGGSFTTLNG